MAVNPMADSFDVEHGVHMEGRNLSRALSRQSVGISGALSRQSIETAASRLTATENMLDNNPDLQDIMEVHGYSRQADFPDFWRDPLGKNDLKPERLREALPRLAVAVVVLNVGIYLNNLSQAWLQQNMAGYYEKRWTPVAPLATEDTVRLWDIGFHMLVPINNTGLADFFAVSVPILMALRFILLPGPMSMRWTLISRWLFIWGILWVLRGISIVTTVLPNPDRKCKPHMSYPNNIWLEAAAIMPWGLGRNELTCQDVLFSGHTVALTLTSLIWIRYIPWTPWMACSASTSIQSPAFLYKLLVFGNMFLGYYCIIASKFHYTADVFMGFMMTLLVFQTYHSAVRLAFLPRHKQSPILGCSVYAFIRWFDKYAVDVAVLRLCIERQEDMRFMSSSTLA